MKTDSEDNLFKNILAKKPSSLHLILSGSTFDSLFENDKECLKRVCIYKIVEYVNLNE